MTAGGVAEQARELREVCAAQPLPSADHLCLVMAAGVLQAHEVLVDGRDEGWPVREGDILELKQPPVRFRTTVEMRDLLAGCDVMPRSDQKADLCPADGRD